MASGALTFYGRAMSLRGLFLATALALAPAIAVGQTQPAPAPAEQQAPAPTVFDVTVVARYPHDPGAFTQGLLWHGGALYESTGRHGTSGVRKVDPATGAVLEHSRIPDDQFGEGLALWQDQLISITWMDGVAHRWQREGIAPIGSEAYPFEGWGLTVLGDSLVASDGSSTLRFLDPEDFSVRREISVTYNGRPLVRLNELELVDGLIFANVWMTGFIVGIDPETGVVRKVIDLRPLEGSDSDDSDAVLNGIAWDAETGRLFVTGKLWPWLYEIRLVERTAM